MDIDIFGLNPQAKMLLKFNFHKHFPKGNLMPIYIYIYYMRKVLYNY